MINAMDCDTNDPVSLAVFQIKREGERETESMHFRPNGDGGARRQATRSGRHHLSIKHILNFTFSSVTYVTHLHQSHVGRVRLPLRPKMRGVKSPILVLLHF